jgi:uncharacterized protein (DUF488 family)
MGGSMTDRHTVFTLGHSNHPIEHFLSLLRPHGIQVVADVRSTPFSRFNPQFNRQSLEASLRTAGIEYLFLGEELGARSSDPSCYDGDRVSYAKLAATESFKRGLRRVLEESRTKRVALMCAERDPLDCHRTILVARELAKEGVPITHIRADGTLEDHQHVMERLVAALKLPGPDLFETADDRFEAAYEVQGRKIAYARTASARKQSPRRLPAKGTSPRQ